MNEMKGVTPPDVIQKNASYLAGQVKFDLTTHSAAAYAPLLFRFCDERPGEENGNMAFSSVADYIGRVYDLRSPRVLRRVATNILLVVHHEDLKIGEVENDAGVNSGTLAKLKNGSPLALKASQVIILAGQLAIPFDLLFEDFDNRPQDLFRAIEAGVPTGVVNSPAEADTDTDTEDEVLGDEVNSVSVPEGVMAAALAAIVVPPAPGEKPSPALIASRVRVVAKKAKVSLTDLLSKIGINNRRHLEQIEKGEGAFTGEQLAIMAVALGVDASIFLTGEGCDVAVKTQQRKSSTTAKEEVSLRLPTVKPTERSEFFKSRCLRNDVELADGVDWRIFLRASQSPETDWFALWSSSTKQGAEFVGNVQKIADKMKSAGSQMKAEMLKLLHTAFFPPQ